MRRGFRRWIGSRSGEIKLALSELMRGRSVVAIAHQLSTVSSFESDIGVGGGRAAKYERMKNI